MLINADSLAKPAKKAAKSDEPVESAEQKVAAKPARRRKTRKAKRAAKQHSEKMLPIGQAKPFILDALKTFKPGDKFKNADVYEHALQLFAATQGIDREDAKARFSYKGLSLAMSALKGVKRQKVKNAGSPQVVVYTASKNMYF